MAMTLCTHSRGINFSKGCLGRLRVILAVCFGLDVLQDVAIPHTLRSYFKLLRYL